MGKTESKIINARIIGFMFIISTIAYMTGSGMIQSIIYAPDYLSSIHPKMSELTVGVILEIICAIAVVILGVTMYSVVKKYNEGIAIGYAGARMLEAVLLAVSGIATLSLIPLSKEYGLTATTDLSYFQTLGSIFIQVRGSAFHLAMISLGVGSIMLCFLLYKSKLIPRLLSIIGIIGYTLMLVEIILQIFKIKLGIGITLFLPGALFELILPLWLFVKGFNMTKTDNTSSEKTAQLVSGISA